MFVFYWEGEDAERFKAEMERLLQGHDGHGAWLPEQFVDLFGVDPTRGLPPLPEQLWGYPNPAAANDEVADGN